MVATFLHEILQSYNAVHYVVINKVDASFCVSARPFRTVFFDFACFLLSKLLEKLAPFEKFQSGRKEGARPGGGIMENLSLDEISSLRA